MNNPSTPQKRNPATGAVFSLRGLGTAAEVWLVLGVLWLEIRDKAAAQVCAHHRAERTNSPLQEPQHVLFLFGMEQGVGKKGITFHSDKKKQTQRFVCLHLSSGYENKTKVDFKELKKKLLYKGY